MYLMNTVQISSPILFSCIDFNRHTHTLFPTSWFSELMLSTDRQTDTYIYTHSDTPKLSFLYSFSSLRLLIIYQFTEKTSSPFLSYPKSTFSLAVTEGPSWRLRFIEFNDSKSRLLGELHAKLEETMTEDQLIWRHFLTAGWADFCAGPPMLPYASYTNMILNCVCTKL